MDCEREISDFYSVCRDGLKEKLGCVLFQLPPSFHYTSERLDSVISALHHGFKNAIEFRNESWWRQEIFDEFVKHKIIFCSVNYPGLPTKIIATTSTGYVRLHGNPKLFYSEYSAAELNQMVDDISHAKKLKEAYIYFNNTASTAGIVNALMLKTGDYLKHS